MHMRLSGHRAAIKKLEKVGQLNTVLNDMGTADHFHEASHNFIEGAELHILEVGNWITPAERKKEKVF
jgi:hypothetical protein